MQVKKKFNHTALYTGILSSRHPHRHVNNAPGSTAPAAGTPGDPPTRHRLRPRPSPRCCRPPARLRQRRCGASVRRTRRIMLWLLILSFFFLVRVNIFAFEIYFLSILNITYIHQNYTAAMCSTASYSTGASHYQTLRKLVNLWARLCEGGGACGPPLSRIEPAACK